MRRVHCLAVFAVVVLVAGCAGEKQSTDGKTTVTFWQFWRPEFVQPIIDRFELEHPEIRVEMQQLTWKSGLQKIEAAVAAGKGPDLCELGSTWLPRFADAGAVVDVTEQAVPLAEHYQMWEAVTLDDRIYGFPWVLGTRALFINRSLFRKAGLDPDQPPETWDALLDAATKIHALDEDIYGFGVNAGERYILYKKFMPFAWGNGARILSADQTTSLVHEPETVKALEFYLSLAEFALLEKQDILDQAFREGRLGMQISGAWNLRTIPDQAPDLDFDVALVPKPSPFAGTHASFAGGEVLVTMTGSKHRDAALTLARYLIEKRNAIELCRMVISVQPAAVGADQDPYYTERPRERLFVKQLESSVAPPAHPEWIRIEEAINVAIERTLHGLATPAEALTEASATIQALLGD